MEMEREGATSTYLGPLLCVIALLCALGTFGFCCCCCLQCKLYILLKLFASPFCLPTFYYFTLKRLGNVFLETIITCPDVSHEGGGERGSETLVCGDFL